MAASDQTIVLVSGGNQGIGLETCKKLAVENPTYHVLMGSRVISNAETAISALPPSVSSSVSPIQLDVTSDKSIAACHAAISRTYGRLDVLVNNAGTAGRHLPAGYDSPRRQLWDEVLSINVTSAALLTEAMVPLLEKAQVPRVVFVSSRLGSLKHTLASETRLVELPWYNTSKTALNMVMAFYAKKYGEQGWKINAVNPGYFPTNLNGGVGPPPTEGAIQACRMATLGKDGPTGTYSDKDGPVDW
ncbi:MAG: hypothetical protein M1838_005125 [Thelocarpon superellum]|nr:MAG: hypothetical protein M1838_005125 [Thelocarpon superellum]